MSNIVTKGPAGFSPEAVTAINRAYEAALKNLGGVDFHADSRAQLGRYVMDLAAAGELDEQRLRERALALLARSNQNGAGQAARCSILDIPLFRPSVAQIDPLQSAPSSLEVLSSAHPVAASIASHPEAL